MSNDSDQTLKTVNASGFPLQIGIKAAVEKARGDHNWRVMTEEHPWKHDISGESGFIDLVLEHQPETHVLVIECKRVRDTQWIFLVPKIDCQSNCRRAKSWHTYSTNDWFGWIDWPSEPPSFESNYCVVAGQDPKNKPMLERVASNLVEATEAFAMEEHSLGIPRTGCLRAYSPVIVTTAKLKICRFDPDKIDITTGLMTESDSENISVIRFRKTLTARHERTSMTHIAGVDREKERTVFVVNSSCFVDFLKKWDTWYSPDRRR